jgi:hypothetical protein
MQNQMTVFTWDGDDKEMEMTPARFYPLLHFLLPDDARWNHKQALYASAESTRPFPRPITLVKVQDKQVQ